MDKPSCYECQYRRNVPGDAHSECAHPIYDDEGIKWKSVMVLLKYGTNVMVTGNRHGIQSGWFNHPVNFDPTWLESCVGFKAKEKSDEPRAV